MANRSYRLIPPRAFVTAIVSLMCISSLGAETQYWTEVLNKRSYAVGASDGVTVAVALYSSTVIDVDVIAFNDTSRNLRIVSGKIRPLAVRRNGAKVRRTPLRRWQYPDQGYAMSASSAVSGPRSQGMGSPVMNRIAKSSDSVDRPPRNEYEPSKQQVAGSNSGSGHAYMRSSSRTNFAPVLVKPGRVGWKAIVFDKRLADWYEVEVTVAGKEFRFKFTMSQTSQDPDGDRLP